MHKRDCSVPLFWDLSWLLAVLVGFVYIYFRHFLSPGRSFVYIGFEILLQEALLLIYARFGRTSHVDMANSSTWWSRQQQLLIVASTHTWPERCKHWLAVVGEDHWVTNFLILPSRYKLFSELLCILSTLIRLPPARDLQFRVLWLPEVFLLSSQQQTCKA